MKRNYKDDKKRSENFGIIPNKIAYYYKEVFNIEIVGLLYKKNLNRKINKEIKNNNCLEIVGISTFDFFILIKDNNKKITGISKKRNLNLLCTVRCLYCIRYYK